MDTWLLAHIPHAARRAFLIVMIAGLALAPAKVSASAVAGQSCQYGGGTGSPIGGLPAAGGSTFTVVQCQSGGTYGYPIVTLQSAAAAAGSSCTGYDPGALRYNTTLSNVEMCNGTNWEFLAASTSTCGSPSGLSFTNVTNATLNTVYTSSAATITFSGCTSGGLSVSVSGAATAQISINGGAWTTSGSISSGQTIQVRLTSSGSVSTGLTATVTIGSSSTNWTVTTRSGSLQVFETPNTYMGGTIGGISGANTICQAAANAAGYSGTYVAIISDNSTSAASNLTLSYPIVNAYNGATIAATNLWVGSISTNITTPSGGLSSSGFSWTGTTAAGALVSGQNCSSWTSTGSVGANGYPQYIGNQQWIYAYTGNACTQDLSLYCIQQ